MTFLECLKNLLVHGIQQGSKFKLGTTSRSAKNTIDQSLMLWQHSNNRVPILFHDHFSRIFPDFSRSKLRFSRTIICGKMLSRTEIFKKNTKFLISYVFLKNFQDFSTTFPLLSFSRTFPGLET